MACLLTHLLQDSFISSSTHWCFVGNVSEPRKERIGHLQRGQRSDCACRGHCFTCFTPKQSTPPFMFRSHSCLLRSHLTTLKEGKLNCAGMPVLLHHFNAAKCLDWNKMIQSKFISNEIPKSWFTEQRLIANVRLKDISKSHAGDDPLQTCLKID